MTSKINLGVQHRQVGEAHVLSYPRVLSMPKVPASW